MVGRTDATHTTPPSSANRQHRAPNRGREVQPSGGEEDPVASVSRDISATGPDTDPLPVAPNHTSNRYMKRNGSPMKRSWSPSRAAMMLERGKTYEEIGDYFGLAKSTVHVKMAGFRALLSPTHVEAFRQRQPAILTATRMRVLDVLNRSLDEPDAHRKNSPYQLAGTHHWLHSDERLERDQSTANVALHELVEGVERDIARRRRASIEPADERA
jgi:hypothetical protein